MNRGLLMILACTFSNFIFCQSLSLDWFARMGSTSFDENSQVAIDALGNVYSVGHFNGTVDFDPGPGTFNLTSSGGFDIFVQKLDANGNFVWAKRMGNSSTDNGFGISLDNNANVFVTGTFNGVVDFDPGAGIFNLISNGLTDIFIQKLDSNGNFVWAKSVGGSNADFIGRAIANDATGNVYITGGFHNTVDFDPNGGVYSLVSSGDLDVFVLKLTNAGDFVWANRMGGPGLDVTYSVTVDPAGSVLVVGNFIGTADFDPSALVLNYTSAGAADIFLEKFDANGNFTWVRIINGAGDAVGRSIITDQSGNVYAAGQYDGSADFDPGAGVTTLTSNGGFDCFVQKLTPNGDLLWAKSTGGGQTDIPLTLALDASNNVYIGGVFQGAVDFDPGVTTYSLSSIGGNDAFIQVLDPTGNFLWAISYGDTGGDLVTCLAIDAANNLHVSGYFAGTVDFDPSSSVFNSSSSAASRDAYVYKLGQCTNSTGTHTQIACDFYTWIDGITYTTSNSTATYSLTNSTGCDSLVTLNLTVNNSVQVTDPHAACGSFTWIDGNIYTQSNSTATFALSTTQGCDSTIVLNLTINNVDLTVTQSGNVLIANQVGATYQWINCANNAVIIGEVGQSFAPTTNGNYAVIVTNGVCSDTSSCITVSTIGLTEFGALSPYSIYPNPSNGLVTISGRNNPFEEMNATVFNAIGEIVYASNVKSEGQVVNLEGHPSGVYMIRISTNATQETLRLILN